MTEILLVEDSLFLSKAIKKRLEQELNTKVQSVSSFQGAETLLSMHGAKFGIALLDFNLPDAPNGEIIDLVLSKNIPCIVFTGLLSDDVRDCVLSKGVIDYIVKDDIHSLDYAASTVMRIFKNAAIKVMVVDDSTTSRNFICSLLRSYQFIVLEANTGEGALRLLDANMDIKLVVTDYSMQEMNGIELTRSIRRSYKKEELAIIGMSTYGNNILSALFIKAGANDFINKPFLVEELHCRITHNIEVLEYIQQVRDLSNRDYLTGLYNRRYFFDVGTKIFARARRDESDLAIAIIDIDHFKRINDEYGHDAGDEVLKKVAEVLMRRFRESDIVCRFGGEEFCVMAAKMDKRCVSDVFEGVRKTIEETLIQVREKEIRLTVSIGVAIELADSMGEMIRNADEMLYRAKDGGRNRMIVSGV